MTLLELTVVVGLVALLSGAAFSIKSVSDLARSRKLAEEMRAVKDAVTFYRERYHAIPGDDIDASIHLDGAKAANSYSSRAGNALIDDIWTGSDSVYTYDEAGLFWQHVRLAGLAAGDPQLGHATNAVNGELGITSGTELPTRPAGIPGMYAVCSAHIDATVARLMDAAMDDGIATSGKVWAARETRNAAVTSATAPTPYQGDNRYTVCMAF